MKNPNIILSKEDMKRFFAIVACGYKTHLTTPEAAEFLGTVTQSIKNSRVSGELFGRPAPEFIRDGTSKLTYNKQTLIEWMEAGKKGTVSGAES